MKSADHLHQQIARATSRLAQLQAQELVVEQRKAVRARAEARRANEQRKRRLAELVIKAGAQDLSDDEIIAALISSRGSTQTSGNSLQGLSLDQIHFSQPRDDVPVQTN